jgi:hypothetical protein
MIDFWSWIEAKYVCAAASVVDVELLVELASETARSALRRLPGV